MKPDAQAESRAVSPVIGVILMVAITVLLAAVVGVMALSFGQDMEQPPQAAVYVEETVIWTDETDDPGDACYGKGEVALDVTLTKLVRADTIYVRAEGGSGAVIWSNPTQDNIGETLRVANEYNDPPVHGVDIDIGGGGDQSLCKGDHEVFRFYADYEGETMMIQTVTVG